MNDTTTCDLALLAHDPAGRATHSQSEQAPLGARPSYDEMLDAAVDYTFPCSDPIAAGGCCAMQRTNGAEPAGLDPEEKTG